MLLFILICGYFVFFIVRYRIFIQTSTMAAIMALGIITQGVLYHAIGTTFFTTIFANLLLALVMALWVSFWVSIVLSLVNGKWIALHYSNPINRFGIGTWVAATSICAILISKHFPRLEFLAETLAYLNTALWFFYVLISIQAFITTFQKQTDKEVHGILLLTTVSTQSMILLFHTVFESIPVLLTFSLLTIGFCFYLISTFLVLKRYVGSSWSIETDWNNTNCILHGALSISGLASIVSGIANEGSLLILWSCTLIIFLIVEAVEVYRLFRLVNRFGWKEGAGTYNVSQWSRIFTFAMFYTFTASIPAPTLSIAIVQKAVAQIGVWVILALFIIEVFLVVQRFVPSNDEEQSVKKIG